MTKINIEKWWENTIFCDLNIETTTGCQVESQLNRRANIIILNVSCKLCVS